MELEPWLKEQARANQRAGGHGVVYGERLSGSGHDLSPDMRQAHDRMVIQIALDSLPAKDCLLQHCLGKLAIQLAQIPKPKLRRRIRKQHSTV